MNGKKSEPDVWQIALEQLSLQGQKSPHFGQVTGVEITGDRATLSVTTQTAIEVLQHRNELIERTLAEVVGRPVAVDFVVVESELPEVEPLADDDPNTFAGFEEPKENWSKLPHALIGALPQVSTISELKVILYILRHTWGYHESERRISLDEFRHGRKRRDGTRIDDGTGLSTNSIKDGIKRAVAGGFIIVDRDERDGARIKQYYRLKNKGIEL